MTMDFKIRPWLTWVFVIVCVGVISYLVWYLVVNKNTPNSVTSPVTSPAQILPTPSPSVTKTSTLTQSKTKTSLLDDLCYCFGGSFYFKLYFFLYFWKKRNE